MKEGALNPLDLQNLNMFDRDLSGFDLERINVNALLFQCGYLTVGRGIWRWFEWGASEGGGDAVRL